MSVQEERRDHRGRDRSCRWRCSWRVHFGDVAGILGTASGASRYVACWALGGAGAACSSRCRHLQLRCRLTAVSVDRRAGGRAFDSRHQSASVMVSGLRFRGRGMLLDCAACRRQSTLRPPSRLALNRFVFSDVLSLESIQPSHPLAPAAGPTVEHAWRRLRGAEPASHRRPRGVVQCDGGAGARPVAHTPRPRPRRFGRAALAAAEGVDARSDRVVSRRGRSSGRPLLRRAHYAVEQQISSAPYPLCCEPARAHRHSLPRRWVSRSA